MKLSYRGTIYEPKSSVASTRRGKVIGKYRGAQLHERIVVAH